MAGTSVVVTGAGGYIGRHVVTAMLDEGHEVLAVVRHRSDDIDARAEVLQADVLDPGFDPTALAERDPRVVVHLAWQDGFVHNAPSHLQRLSAHFDFLVGLAESGIGRIAALGTMHEVGYWEGAIDATTPTNPSSLYGIAKDALRRSTMLAIGDRAEYLWQRCYYIYGDDRRSRSVFSRILEAADAGRDTFPFTTGRNRYDFISVEGLARQIAVSALAVGEVGVINCASGVPVTLADRVEQFIADHGLGIRLEYGAFPDRPYDSPGVWADAERIHAIMSRQHRMKMDVQ